MPTFDCACANVSDKLGQPDSGTFHFLKSFILGNRHWRFLDNLLVTTLHGAITSKKRDCVAILIGQKLNLQMTRLARELHDEDGRT
jgi:hypothetical protein